MIQTVVKYFFLLSLLCFGRITPVLATTIEHSTTTFCAENNLETTPQNQSCSIVRSAQNFSQDATVYSCRKELEKPEFLYFESESKNKYDSLISVEKRVIPVDSFLSHFHNSTSASFLHYTSFENAEEIECFPKKHFYLLFLSIRI